MGMNEIEGTKEIKDIKMIVNDELSLYTPFSPEAEFTGAVKEYIKSKTEIKDYKKTIRLTVVSDAPVDEDRFRSAIANWMQQERRNFDQEATISARKLIGMLVIASIFIILSIVLTKYINVLTYTIIPVLGSVALGNAASIYLMDLPINRRKRKMLDELEKSGLVAFEQIRKSKEA